MAGARGIAVRGMSSLVLALVLALPACLQSLPVPPKTLSGGRALFLPLAETRYKNASGVVTRALARHPLRRQLNEARMWLYGHVLTEGYYYTMLGLGSPAQQFALIVDTGSTVTYVPCKSCTHCGKQHQDNPYIPASSSSYQSVACAAPECPGHQCGPNQVCSYARHYAEDSTSSGVIASDLASFGDASTIAPTRILFGCETSETGDLYSQRADGIIGMGKGQLSIMNQLVGSGATENQFSLCYGGMARGGGAMILGAVPPPPPMQFVPLDVRPGEGTYYNVDVEGLSVAGQRLNLATSMFNEGYGSVLDSGTTFTYLPSPAFRAVKQAVTEAVKLKGLSLVAGPDPHYNDVCFGPATEDPSLLPAFFPTITLILKPNVSYDLAPENFLFRHTADAAAYCLGLFENKDRGTLLGGILVRNTMVTYDRANSRVGFWKTNCSNLFETLTNLEGAQAPPLTPELVDEPPSDYVPGAEGQQQTPADVHPPAPVSQQSDSSCTGCASQILIAFQVPVASSSFADMQDQFREDVARELSIDKEQVSDISYEEAAGSSSGSAAVTVVHAVLIPPPEFPVLSAETVQRIQTLLQNAEFSLREEFGAVKLESFSIVPPKPATSYTYVYIVGALAAFTLVAVLGIILWRQWSKRSRFDPLAEERREEKAALAETTHEQSHEQADAEERGMEMESKGSQGRDQEGAAEEGRGEEQLALRSSAPHL